MINIVVILEVSNQKAFDEFESKAISILRSHDGELVTAFEAEENEIHVIQFPTMNNFTSYKNDPALKQLTELRSKAIQSTKVYVSEKLKEYE